jgi:outer membrane autotransporter protein
LTNFFDSTGGIPGVFAALTADQLTQASGEGGADTTQTAFGASNLFMNLLLDRLNDAHGSSTGEGGALGYANTAHDTGGRNNEAVQAYAAVTPKDRRAPSLTSPASGGGSGWGFDRRWSLWASGYGGSASVSGDAATGSHDTTDHIYGMAAGADYHLSPDTLFGFALGGAGFNFDLSDGLGSGRADLFQAGLYGRHWFGPAYVAAALAYGWQDVKTSRTVTISGTDQLEAEFEAQTFAARGEAGYRFATPWLGVTPYAALQATSFHSRLTPRARPQAATRSRCLMIRRRPRTGALNSARVSTNRSC